MKFGVTLAKGRDQKWRVYYIQYHRLKLLLRDLDANPSSQTSEAFLLCLNENIQLVGKFYILREAEITDAIQSLDRVCAGSAVQSPKLSPTASDSLRHTSDNAHLLRTANGDAPQATSSGSPRSPPLLSTSSKTLEFQLTTSKFDSAAGPGSQTSAKGTAERTSLYSNTGSATHGNLDRQYSKTVFQRKPLRMDSLEQMGLDSALKISIHNVEELTEEQNKVLARFADIEKMIKRLKDFAELNVEGMRKIAKKFDKARAKIGADMLGNQEDKLEQDLIERNQTHTIYSYEERLNECRVILKDLQRMFTSGQDVIQKPDGGVTVRRTTLMDALPQITDEILAHEDSKGDKILLDAMMEHRVVQPTGAGYWFDFYLHKSLGKTRAFLVFGWQIIVYSTLVYLVYVTKFFNVAAFNDDSWITIWLVGIALWLLVNQFPPDCVMGGCTLMLQLFGVLGPTEAWQGFSNPVVMSVAILSAVSDAVSRTGAINMFFLKIMGEPTNLRTALVRLFIPACLLNVCISNTCVMSVLIPLVENWSEKIGFHRDYFLMPLSYVLLISGTFAIFSTSSNLITQALLLQEGYSGFSNFEIAPLSLAASAVCGIVVIALSPLLLHREKAPDGKQQTRKFEAFQ